MSSKVPKIGLYLEKTMNNDLTTSEPIQISFLQRRKLRTFYQQFIGNSDFAITIGDTHGNVSEAILQQGSMLLAVEPLPEVFDFVVQKLQKYDKAIFIHEDIGAFNAEFTYNEAYEKNILPYSSNLTVSANSSIVKITTVDELIYQYGLPTFIKINANGYENDVLKGLSKSVLVLAVSFYSYLHEKTIENVRRILTLGNYEFNWIVNEEPKFQSKNWLSAKDLHTSMSAFSKEQRFSGEIFARIKIDE